MFEYRDGKKFCTIHPGTELSHGSTKTKKGLKLIWVCSECDTLVEQLKQIKAPEGRYLK